VITIMLDSEVHRRPSFSQERVALFAIKAQAGTSNEIVNRSQVRM